MSLANFYEDSEIFVTGGSGVVGKALIEKLLRSCNVRRIYVLLRPRRQLSAEQRLVKLRQATIFHVLHQEKPDELDKLVAVPGDVLLPGLGIDPAMAAQMSKVSLVYHCAATVRFDEPLRVALQLNVGGTFEAIKFAETLAHLRVFVHVSTFYSNPYLKFVEPKYYSSPMDWRLCLRVIEEVPDDGMLNALTRKLIVGFPNTYTFTKNLAESLVNDYRCRLPLIIYRPSIVLFAVDDPSPGFSPSLMGAMGLFALVGAGILKTVYLGKETRLDITPQDVGIKCMLSYTKKGQEKYQKGPPKEIPVYMSSSCTHVPHTFTQIAEQMDTLGLWKKAAFEKSLMVPGCHYTDRRWVYQFLVFTKQILPALLIDLLLRLFGKRPQLMGVVRKAYQTLEVMQPFMFNNYDSPGVTEKDEISKENHGTDFHLNPFTDPDINGLVIRVSGQMLYSIRAHLFKEDPCTLPRSQRIHTIKTIIYQGLRLILLYKLVRWIWASYLGQHF
ncbi:fatty acyl-CoA reductase wat [Drosophila persimilis]|uniref:Fatty acyl-CoA reductase n=2 Tax=pseudoobscura subgroup TaxID=32358 RepID=Q29JL4_DROPS|nr:fatty acyl-CoA reductase wat [Drosophila pseudoobscura]XP_002025268.2 fatty acyl-CoA reductase wat [Drosophila persimilis]